MLTEAYTLCEGAHGREVRVFVEGHPVLEREALASVDLASDLGEPCTVDERVVELDSRRGRSLLASGVVRGGAHVVTSARPSTYS